MVERNYIETTEGTPQGGIISPVLCNIALNGLEEEVKKAFPMKRGITPGVHLIRYADDMVITGRTEGMLYEAKDIVREFLKVRGLELNEKKTKLTHIKEGFDFLGFNIRRRKRLLTHNGVDHEQDTILIVKPSVKGIDKFKDRVKQIITRYKPFLSIIKEINPVIRG